MLGVFERYKDSNTNLLSLDGLRNALQHLDAIMDEQSLSDLFHEIDVNSDRGLDVDEFRMLVHKTSKIQQWTAAMPLAALVADAMPRNSGADALRIWGRHTTHYWHNVP